MFYVKELWICVIGNEDMSWEEDVDDRYNFKCFWCDCFDY